MSVPQHPSEQSALVAPVIDYEPPVIGTAACRSVTPLRRRAARAPRVARPAVREAAPPPTAVMFADAALRRVLEVIDRRRPVAQLRPLLAPALLDSVIAMTRPTRAKTPTATLRRLRVRTVDGYGPLCVPECEVFGTYTRGRRVHALAARIELHRDRWRLVALQLG
ncbi:Rv3235 family protein [Mycolicibacterium sp. XJ1819]